MNKKHNWGVYIAYLLIIAFFVSVGFIAGYMLLDRIAQETDARASLLGEWWQVLLFVIDVILILAAVGCGVMSYLQSKKEINQKVTKETINNKLLKVVSPGVSGTLVTFFAILFTIFTVGQSFAHEYEDNINYGLGIDPYETIVNPNSDSEHVKSDYVKKDENGNPLYVTDETGYRHQVYDDRAMRTNSLEVCEEAADEGTVLMWNKGETSKALPISKGSKISIFGVAQTKNNYLFTGSGSGGMLTIKHDDFPNLKEELEIKDENNNPYYEVNPTLWNYYASAGGGRQTITPDITADKHFHTMKINEKPWSQINAKDSFKDYGDAAIMILSRNAGEDMDTWFDTEECLDNDFLDLSINEKDVLDNLVSLKKEGVFKKIVLLLNTCNALQMKNILSYSDIDACVNVGTGGLTSFKTIFNILSGKVNPSGHLVDTYAYDNESAPASVNTGAFQYTRLGEGFPADNRDSNEYNNAYIVYQEGIYVGYRYYETRYEDTVMNKGDASSSKGAINSTGSWKYQEEVAFPFGHGLSYTDFKYELLDVKERKSENKKYYDVNVKVTNIGEVAGKTAVQIYLQKPYTQYDIQNKIEKASIELAGYTKTKLLEPNASDTYTVSVDEYEFKSYDAYNKKTYILEKGDYYLSTGLDAHDALNNILAKKGFTGGNGMVDSRGNPCDGNENLTYKIEIKNDDFVTYSKSPTGYDVTNQFDNADRNLYEGTKDQPLTYLSRNNWGGTYPTSHSIMKATNPILVQDIKYNEFNEDLIDPNAKMPTYGAKNGMTLAMLKGADFNAPQWQDLLDNLTFDETKSLLGQAVHIIRSVGSINSPAPLAYDGPAGIRVVNPTLGTQMAFPQSVVLAQSMNDELVEEVYEAFSHEMLHAGIGQVYGTAANIHRSAYSGRNWEYISEDGYISGKILSAEVKGLQSKGAVVNVKHFALNDQEIYRCGLSTWANEQSIREIYLKGFEAGITEGKANGVMSSLNRIGAEWAGVHKGLLTEVLRKEWGFIGLVETDSAVGAYMKKGAASAEAVIAGNNLWLTGGGCNFDEYKDNPTVCQAMRERAHEVLYVLVNSMAMNGFDSDTMIIRITPWYFNAITAVQIISGIILAASIALLVYLIIVKKAEYAKTHDVVKEREERRILKEKLKQERKQKNSEVISITRLQRNVTIGIFGGISSLLLVGLITSTVVFGNIISSLNEKIENGDFVTDNEDDETIVPPEEHECETKCYNCGYCLDMSCFETNCGTKCGDNLPNVTELDGSHYYVAKTNVTYDEENDIIQMINGSTLLYKVNVSNMTNVSFGLKIITNSETKVNDLLSIKVGNSLLNTPVKTKQSSELYELIIGCMNIVQGDNLIEVSAKNNVMMGGIVLYHNASSINLLEAPGAEHVCESKCEWVGCEGCVNYDCEHPSCENKCPHLNNEFKAIDPNVIVVGGNGKNNGEDCVGSSSKELVSIEFPLYSSANKEVKLFVTISGNKNSYDFTKAYKFYINNELQTSDAKTPIGQQFHYYEEVELGMYHFKEGSNIVKFTINITEDEVPAFNFKSLKVQTEAKLSWAEVECSSVCGFCGGCTDLECMHDVCKNKCSCYGSSLSVLDNKVKVLGQDKNTSKGFVAVKRDVLVEIIYTVNVSNDCQGEISFDTSTWSSNRNMIQPSEGEEKTIHAYDFYINDQEVYSDAKTTICSTLAEDDNNKFEEFTNTTIGIYDLKQGKNVFKVTVLYPEINTVILNFRAMGLRVNGATFTWESSFE